MRLQRLSTTAASDDDGRVRSLGCQRCSIQRNILVEIVELYMTGVAWQRLSRSAVRKNDIMTFQLDMQVMKNLHMGWLPAGNAVPVNEIPCRNQKTIYEKAVPVGHAEITVRQIAIECTARDSYRS